MWFVGPLSASDSSVPCDSGYIEMKRPTGFAGYIDMSCGRQSSGKLFFALW